MIAFDIPLGAAPPPTFADDPRDIAAALKAALDHIRREAAEVGEESP